VEVSGAFRWFLLLTKGLVCNTLNEIIKKMNKKGGEKRKEKLHNIIIREAWNAISN